MIFGSADCIYGESTPLRQTIERAGKWYVLAVRSVTRVWRERPALLAPADVTGGRPRRAVRLAPGAPKATTVAAVIAQLPRQRWRRLSVGAGAKGARIYDWACLRVIESRDDLPGPGCDEDHHERWEAATGRVHRASCRAAAGTAPMEYLS